MDRRAKGLRIQRKAREYWEDKGYLVYMIHHTRWSKDMFGLFDFFALKKNTYLGVEVETDELIIFGQVKANSFPPLKKYQEFKKNYPYVRISLMNWVDRKGWKIKNI